MSDRPARFLILYDQRVGSSPIVSMLSHQDGVRIPLFEQFDRRYFPDGLTGEEVAAALDRTLTTGRFDLADGASPFLQWREEEPAAIGFKWRMWGDPARNIEVLKAQSATVFILVRRDPEELAASLYMTHKARNRDVEETLKHPQFRLARGSAETAEQVRRDYSEVRLFVRPWELAGMLSGNMRFLAKATQLARQMRAAGISVRVLYYEDFTADRSGFIAGMLDTIGVEAREVVDQTAFRKVARVPAKKRLAGYALLRWYPALQLALLRRRRALAALEAVAGG